MEDEDGVAVAVEHILAFCSQARSAAGREGPLTVEGKVGYEAGRGEVLEEEGAREVVEEGTGAKKPRLVFDEPAGGPP